MPETLNHSTSGRLAGAAASDVVIGVDGLQKTFRLGFFRRKVNAVEHATFEVHRGEIFGLVGHNGAGKTTCMKMMLGLIRPDAGTGHILGVPISESRSRAKVGFLPESPHFYDYLRPAEVLDYFAGLYGMDRHMARRRIPELIERVGLKGAEDKQLRKFSKGMLQRLGLAQALLPDSEIVILDEPQSGLDPLGRKDVRDIIVELKQRGKTVLFSSHVLPDVEHVCDRLAMMVRGRVTLTGTLDELLADQTPHIELVARLAGDAATALPGFESVRLPDGRLRFDVPDQGRADELIVRLVEGGHSVHSVIPHRRSLEELFVTQTRGGKP
jgi:ABC-2 type transport system ATP-binding protein